MPTLTRQCRRHQNPARDHAGASLQRGLRNAGRYLRRCAWLSLLSAASAAAETPTYTLTTLAEDLDHPWCVAFLPDGDMLFTERTGALRVLHADGRVGEPVAGVPPVLFRGQGGLFDVLPDPGFATNQRIYLSFAHGTVSANATRVVSARLDANELTDVQVLFTAEPLKDTPQHYGGKLAMLADGTLLLTTGDGFDYREQAQNPEVTLGKTVRFRVDGSLPADNPFADGGGHPAVWTMGHRNPQGLAVDPASGAVYLHEHGPRGGDEINLLAAGSNYGWPAVTFGIDYSGAHVSPFTEWPGMTPPLHYWVPSIAASGLVVYRGSEFPAWEGSLLVGALVDQEVRRVTRAADGAVAEEALFSEIGERIRDVRVAPDGAIVVVTDGNPGRILRIAAGP